MTPILSRLGASGNPGAIRATKRRYEHASTVLTSNKGFEEWGEIFGDEVMAAALIDRLVHHCHIVNIRGNSYRMRHHADLHRALGTPRHAAALTPHPGPAHARRRLPRPDGSPPTPTPKCAILAGESVQFYSGVDNHVRSSENKSLAQASPSARRLSQVYWRFTREDLRDTVDVRTGVLCVPR